MKAHQFMNLMNINRLFVFFLFQLIESDDNFSPRTAAFLQSDSEFDMVFGERHEATYSPHRHPNSTTTIEESDHSIQTPFVIGIWILFASIAKIGENFILKLKLCF